MYDEKGRLTRAGALAVIAGGGSVSLNGKLYVNAANLPNEAEFAKGDEKQEAAARARLQQQIDDAKKQLDALDAPAAAPRVPLASAPNQPGTVQQAGDNLDDLTAVELKNLAAEKKVQGYGSMNKADLIAALRA